MNIDTWIFVVFSVVIIIAAVALVMFYRHQSKEKDKVIRRLEEELEAVSLELMRQKAGLGRRF